jgi:hypothetical protein
MSQRTRADVQIAAALAAALFLVYNANGREIPTYDSQPNKFAARELLVRHTAALNHVVGALPGLADRPAFVTDVNGRYRSAYSPVPALLAAAIAWPLWKMRVLDPRAPLAPGLIAKLGASLLTALAVAFAYLAARDRTTRLRSALVAIGLGLGTGLWSAVSQTLWVHESAILGMAIAVLCFAAPVERISAATAIGIGAGLALAGAARPQLAPMVAVLLAGTFVRSPRAALLAAGIVAAAAAVVCVFNIHWFGHPFGPVSMMVDVNRDVHGTRSTFHLALDGFAGLLVAPNRGLLIFSPVVLIAAAGVRAAVLEGWRSPLRWCALAALAQYGLFGAYSVWWAGHTYGPRYLLDALPLLVPLAAAALARDDARRSQKVAAAAVLAWSIVVAGTGAFVYPNDEWNVVPSDVDRKHARLWSWSDTQIVRCWQRGPSPQNFSLFSRDAFRPPVH